ncbi:MAG: type II toxin-antitoxin system Phd/YefM family antitoxin [Chloroflexi bacterium]|nr:type II toxin-antitoxin system Phd/YefM family antitoxin [Chloroflexota bacterium]
MTTLTAKEARFNFSDLLSRAAYQQEKFIITRNGRKIAALVPVEYFELVEKILEEIELRQDTADAKAALEEYERTGESISLEELRAKLGL